MIIVSHFVTLWDVSVRFIGLVPIGEFVTDSTLNLDVKESGSSVKGVNSFTSTKYDAIGISFPGNVLEFIETNLLF